MCTLHSQMLERSSESEAHTKVYSKAHSKAHSMDGEGERRTAAARLA